ncbi:ergosterol biosynthesis ERG4/ERG24 family-domain-containing protein [Aspergillus pseudocaelatus]|uniref:7-dehydrocholesterol reductase n=1 Tax=Aspergillus pseudocaelatus TaxID=1825620 RepID=A0ABQ6WDT5_9EURO|nr:ergosterol biosynthesis ERG4/ERG24 family-domain-containing protein [Aspergillus pseudocaelatus]
MATAQLIDGLSGFASGKGQIQKTVTTGQKALWGRRHNVSGFSSLPSMMLMVGAPLLVLLISLALTHYDGSITKVLGDLYSQGALPFLTRYCPSLTTQGIIAYISWLGFQAFLYQALPGRIVSGPPTPGGYSLPYKVNGLWSWFATLAVFIGLVKAGRLDPMFVAVHQGELIIIANMYGFLITAVSVAKSHLCKQNTRDIRFSGSIIHDFLSGVELNPRLGKYWDLKLFQIGRVGMNSWVLVDLSFAALQYQKFGYLTNTMVVVNLLHALYVVDFFVNEDWYLSTIDIALDHFGFNLAWGSAVWLPVIYTTQAHYLAYHPVQLSGLQCTLLLVAGITGYVIFRDANHQKYRTRQSNGTSLIWGQKPSIIRATYQTTDGSSHSSMLLYSGWWGLVRHPNYIGDLIFSFCTCAGCGFSHIIPWTYFCFMASLLIHRSLRDDARCSSKYGDQWTMYCKTVPWRLIPGLF